MTLGDKRREFTKHLGMLIGWACGNGYEVQIEEAKRSPAQAALNASSGAGIRNSLHIIGLATDFSAFKNGVFLQSAEDYRPLGAYWKSLHPENVWGGDFKDAQGQPKPDADHFSRSHEGVK
jgi:hypothetical protein